MNLLIRKMNEEDIEAVTALEAASFTTPWSKDAFTSSLKDSNYRYPMYVLAHFIEDRV